MKNLQSKLNLPHNVVETSSVIYRRALKANLIRGRTTQKIVVACLYMACRQCGVLRSLEEVADSINSSKKDVGRNYRFLVKSLKTNVPHTDPQGYISRIVSKLMLSGETEILAKSLLYQATSMKLTGGRAPAGLAAACVYISTKITGDRRSQINIAKEAQVTEVTIRNRYKELVEHLDLEIKL
jgi:transcription initiation factor TFIIB